MVEGPCGVVLPLASRILADPRHTAIRITAFGPLETRRFASWSARGFDFIDDPEDRAHAENLRLLPVAQPGLLARRAASPGAARHGRTRPPARLTSSARTGLWAAPVRGGRFRP